MLGTKLDTKLGTKLGTKIGTKLGTKLGTKRGTKLGTMLGTNPGMIQKVLVYFPHPDPAPWGGGAWARAGPRSRHRSLQLEGKHKIVNKHPNTGQA